MKRIEDYSQNLVKLHAWKCKEGTNNTIFYNACISEINDKKMIFPSKLKQSLGLPGCINSFYDQKKFSGAYERLWDITIISLCSDIEYFFKDLFKSLFPDQSFRFGFYQRITEVIKFLKNNGFDFSKIDIEINNIIECFQVRHIATHNMGYVDESFISKVETCHQINEKFIVTQDLYKEFYESYMSLLENIDDFLSER